MAVQRMLKAECAMAMPAMPADSFSSAGAKMALTMQNTVSSTATPMTLNIRCTTAARLATQVPMFCPMMMGTAAA